MDLETELEQAWAFYDRGDHPALADCLEGWRRAGLGDLSGGVLSALLALDLGDFSGARQALAEARGRLEPEDPNLGFAAAEIDLAHWRVEDARRGFRRLCDLEGAGGLLLRLSLCEDLCGDFEAGDRAIREARAVEPEAFGELVQLSAAQFEALVAGAAARLPELFQHALERFPVLIDPVPERALAAERPLETPPDALGLFVGHSDLERSSEGEPQGPAAIYLFQRNLERFCRGPQELAQEIEITLYHELGHALGFDEAGLTELGLE